MTTTVELSTPLESFPLSGIIQTAPAARVVFEPVVHHGGEEVWSFRVHEVDTDSAAVEEILDADEHVRRSRVVDANGNQMLIEVTWKPRAETTTPSTTSTPTATVTTTSSNPNPNPGETRTRERAQNATETETGTGTAIGTSADPDQVLLAALAEHDMTMLALSGTKHGWEFTLRFPDRETTKAFQTAALTAGHSLSIEMVSDLDSNSDSGHLGTSMDQLTPAQREVVTLALNRGYFEIPRQATLVDLAEEIGVSDQAVSERLRRAQAKLGRAAVSAEHS